MQKTRPIGHYLLFVWIIFLYVFACYCALNFNNRELTTIVNMTIPQDFRARLVKHGLDRQVSLIEIGDGELYFYRDGKRCKF